MKKSVISLLILPLLAGTLAGCKGIFGEFGLEYLGPVDGHNTHDLIRIINEAKNLMSDDNIKIEDLLKNIYDNIIYIFDINN